MDTKLKSYSHSVIIKILVFIIVIGCFTGAINKIFNVAISQNDYFSTVFEDSYYSSEKFKGESSNIVEILTRLTVNYKNEEYILKGESITEDRIKSEESKLFDDFRYNSKIYNPTLSYKENYDKFKENYAAKISQINEKLIREDLKSYNSNLVELKNYKGVIYYTNDGVNELTNGSRTSREYFESLSSYMIYDKSEQKVYPKDIIENQYNKWITLNTDNLSEHNSVMYIGFTDEYLDSAIKEWQENKGIIKNSLYQIAGFLLGLIVSFIYLVVVIGRKTFKDKEVHLNYFDRLYNDFNLAFCLLLIGIWGALVFSGTYRTNNIEIFRIPATLIISSMGLILVLSLMKHLKNKTLIKHTLIYSIFHKIFISIKEIYNSGNIGVKVALLVIGYSAALAVTFFMFPVTIGIAVWLAFKKTKEFNEIKEGVQKVKNGDINHKINVISQGEFGNLASNINSITEGLNKAVENELKSQRLKTELITNVSHDIRTPLTSIITYVDLLKREGDKSKADEYIEIIDQKAHRLKVLTEDLFEATKASSQNTPVNYEKIEVISLITQGLGELNDKVEELELEFKFNDPSAKVYITADGKLFWRVIENLLSNIFKYALNRSRVYINIEDLEDVVMITIKNISAYELNISSEELMERFKRGDESRSSQGSGLGLSIAKSLVENQNGRFNIEIDGDLFKAIIQMPRYKE